MERFSFAGHKEFPPDSVFFGWQISGVPDYDREMIIPAGCIEIIFNFSDDRITYGPGNSREDDGRIGCGPGGGREDVLPRCFISGINTVPVVLDHSSHHAFFGLRLHPQVVRPLVSVPSGEFINKTVDLTLLDPMFNRLWHELYPAGFEGRTAIIRKWIRQAWDVPRHLDIAIGGFFAGPVQDMTVAHLADQFCSSQRNLTRKFNELLGMSTEQALLYKKYLHALGLVHYTDHSLTEIAYRSKFYDQSHFTREFRRYSGLTPKDYRKYKGAVCGHIYRQRVNGVM